jgi:transcriptional regulator with XRE-family HTH domain
MIDRDRYYRAFGRRLRRVRKLRSLSEQDAAAAYGVTVATYRRHEAGARQRGNADRLIDFTGKLNVSFNWLVSGRGSPEEISIGEWFVYAKQKPIKWRRQAVERWRHVFRHDPQLLALADKLAKSLGVRKAVQS